MNLKTAFKVLCTLLFFNVFSQELNAQQDTLFKTNGEKIGCKVLEIGTKAISFKKASNIDGPTFTENIENVSYLKLKNGQIEEFTKAVKTTTTVPTEMNTATTTIAGNNNNGAGGNEYKIIREGKNYFVNGQKITPKNVDRLLSKSNNPAVLIPFKVAKTTKTIQKIIKITSFPSTLGGMFGCFTTFSTVIKQSKNEGVSTSSWINAGAAFVGTISLPITSKILKKRTNKLYDKTIDVYNVGKK